MGKPMNCIIAGTRTIDDYDLVCAAITASGFAGEITCVISGGAQGVDLLGERWAREQGLPYLRFPAGWQAHGRGAGPIRNEQMAQEAQALIAIWDGASRGTHDMLRRARDRGLRVFVYHVD